MRDAGAPTTVSRSAFLQLGEEERLVESGYELLDEKRIQLAAEMLRQRQAYREARARFVAASDSAAAALLDAAASQGLDALQVQPAATLENAGLDVARRRFVGIELIEATFDAGAESAADFPPWPGVVRSCAGAFRALLEAGLVLGLATANLERLIHDYERTERRVRALEHVILPEIRSALVLMEEQLDLNEQEEVIRVHSHKRP